MELFATHKFPLATELYGWIRRGAGFNEFRGIAVELFENLQSKFTSLKKPYIVRSTENRLLCTGNEFSHVL